MEDTLRRQAAEVNKTVLQEVCPNGPFRPGEVFDVEQMIKRILDRMPELAPEQYYLVTRSQDYERIQQLLGDETLGQYERTRRCVAIAIILYLQADANRDPQVAGELRRGSKYGFGGHAPRNQSVLPLGNTTSRLIRQMGELVELWLELATLVVLVYFRDENGCVRHYEASLLDEETKDPHVQAARYLFRNYLPI